MAATDDLGSIIEADARGRRWRWIIAAVVVALAVAVGTYALTHRGSSTATIPPTPATVTSGTLAITTSTTGTAAAAKSQDLSFTAAGQVTSVDVKPGQTVKQGQVLAQLDTTDAQRSLDSANASLQSAQLKLQALISPPTYTSDVASADQTVVSAKTALLNAQQALQNLTSPTQASLDSAHQSVLSAQASLSNAQQNLDSLQNPSATDVATSQSAVTNAQQSLAAAQTQVQVSLGSLLDAQSAYCAVVNQPAACVAQSLLPLDSATVTLLVNSQTGSANSSIPGIGSKTSSLLQANSSYASALANEQSAQTALTIAQQNLNTLLNPTPQQLYQARQSLAAAEQALSVAQQNEQTLLHPTAADITAAQNAVTAAQAGLTSAEVRAAQTKAGTDPNTIQQQQLAVQQAQEQVATAQQTLDGLTLKAPFDGVVGAVNITAGSQVAASAAAITVLDPNAIEIDLTASETDLPNLKVGQLGFATFDALPNERFIVQVDSIGTVPTTSQGVVTYPVTAAILQGPQLAAVAPQLESLAAALGGGRTRAAGTATAGAAQGTATARRTATAGAAGRNAATPSGTTGAAGGATRSGGFAGGGGFAAALANQTMPAPGMSATITLLTKEDQNVLLVPSAAVHTQGRTSFVYVPDANGQPKQQDVVTGASNGTQVEITSGLKAGDTVLLNVLTSAAAATPTTGAAGSFGGGFGGGGGRGGPTGGLR